MMSFSTFNYRLRIVSGCAITLLLLTFGCSKSTDPDTNKQPDIGPVGILLSGADTNPALSGTSNHGPFAVPESEWDGDFVTTRLEAIINPSSTVGAVNSALNAVGAKISCMRAGLMFVELVVPALSSVDQAKTVCSTLAASGAFLSAYPCFDPTDAYDASIFPGSPANGRLTHLENPRFPAAWNLRDRVASLHSPATVVVVDDFTRFTSHPEIPALQFVAGAGRVDTLLNDQGEIDGNHGFAVAGVIGARFDDIGSTGAYVDPAALLRIPCVATKGLASWVAIMTEMHMRLPLSGKFMLNTSWGYGGRDFSLFSKRQRIEHALYWRSLVALRQGDFLHTQSAGNEGIASPAEPNADYNTPFTLTARFDTPLQMLQGTAVFPADTAALNTMYARMVTSGSVYAAKLRNVLTVGSSDWNGNLSTFSNGPSDLRMIGESVTLPCAMADGNCNPGTDVAWQGRYNGTSFAAPQVAALAAWLWSLSPALTVDETIAIIKNCYNNKWVDAYKAVLSLDHSFSNAGIRLSLLDIADASGQIGSDLKFDEKDLQMFLDSILYYEANRGSISPPWARDHSPFDLNGDGYTGDTMLTPSTAPFDLDINTPPAYSAVDVIPCDQPSAGDTTLNESAVTDRGILLYYAYSPIYQGNDPIRDSLLGKSCSPFWTGSESTVVWVLTSLPTLGILEQDSSLGGSLLTNLDEARDSVSSTCKTGYHWEFAAGGSSSLSAGGGSSSLSVSGEVSIQCSAKATAVAPPPVCEFAVGGFAKAISVVRFAYPGNQSSLSGTLVISGTVQPTNSPTTSHYARLIVKLFTVDTTQSARGATSVQRPTFLTFDSDYNPLPFQTSVLLTPLPVNSVYQMELSSYTYESAITQKDPGPHTAKVNVSVSLFGGQ